MKKGTLDILKGALILERRGKAFYESVAEQSKIQAVREVFSILAQEEEKHIAILGKHYSEVATGGPITLEPTEGPTEALRGILTERVQQEIEAAGYEAAAIAAGMALEEQAVKFYSDQAREATSPEERELYRWLAEWEKTHLDLLSSMDRDLRERIWYDSRFWPLT